MKRDERGFAMLLVFALAAAVAITLYIEVPRVAFESQRNKEQLLIERGEQYKRAIELFVRKEGRYPSNMDELEKLNNRRYLRRRYVDPMTGKNEWRIIHIQNGVFTDSLVHKKEEKEGDKNKNTFISEFTGIGQTNPLAGVANPALRRRESEKAGAPGMPGSSGAPTVPGDPTVDPNAVPQPGQTQATPGIPGLPAGQFPPGVLPGQTGAPNQVNPAQPGQAYPGAPGQPYPAQMGQPGQPFPAVNPVQQPGMQQPGMQAGVPGAYPQTGVPGAAGNPAADMIRGLLTQPRPGGAPMQSGTAGMNLNGIAGVASTAERTGIKIYAERDKYNEWEFLYDLSKDRKRAGAMSQSGMMGTGSQTNPGQTTNPMGGGSPLQSIFGNNPTVPPPVGAQPQLPGRTR